jgi:hypothetical protein
MVDDFRDPSEIWRRFVFATLKMTAHDLALVTGEPGVT